MIGEKLSVIIPLYNTSKYLRKCIESIISQTYKNLEIIIVNDNSPDIDDDIIGQEYQKKDNRIVYIKHDVNRTQAGARNSALKIATGKYVTFIDADDFLIDSTAYEQAINSFKSETNIVVFSFDIYKINNNKYELKEKFNLFDHYNKVDKFDNKIKSFIYQLALWNKIYILDDIRKNNLYFIENQKIEDLYFWFIYVINVEPNVQFINKSFYGYLSREDSDSNNYFNDISYFRIIISYIKEYYQSLDINMREKWRSFYIHIISQSFWAVKYIDKLNDNKKEIEGIKTFIDIIKYSELSAYEVFKRNYMFIFKYCMEDKYIRELYSNSLDLFENKYLKKIKKLRKRSKGLLISMIISNFLLIIAIIIIIMKI